MSIMLNMAIAVIRRLLAIGFLGGNFIAASMAALIETSVCS